MSDLPKDTKKVYRNEFATCDERGNPVKYRFNSAAALVSVYNQMCDSDLQEANRRSIIKKAHEFYKPFNTEKLKAKGLGQLTNVNFGLLAGQIDARSAAMQDLALDTTDLVELRPLSESEAGPDAEKIAKVVQEEFSVTLRESRKFIPAVTACVREGDLYGLGPVTWQDQWDYQPMSIERGQLKFDENASAVSAENEIFMVESTLPNWYFFSLFDDPEGAAKLGWNLAVVRQYIIEIFSAGSETQSQQGDATGTSVIESQISLWRQNRYFETKQFEVTRVLHAYVREVSGGRKITHYMVPASGKPDGFLFVKYEAYENMDQCMVWLPAQAASRYAREVRGVASKLLPISDLNNRLLCQMYDFAFRDMTFKMKSSVPGGAPKASITEHGPFTIVGSEAEPINFQQSGNMQQIVGLMSVTEQKQTTNAGGGSGIAANPESTFKGNSRRTKEEIAQEGRAGERQEQSLFILRLTVFDTIFRECFRRFMNLVNGDAELRARYPGVDDFIERCKRRKVSAALLKKVPKEFKLYMCRDLVTGGVAAKAANLTEVLTTIGGNFDEKGRINATRDLVVCRFGHAAADRYRPEVNRDNMPSDAASHATLENNAMMVGQQAMVGPDQLHWSHIPIHMQAITQILEAAQNGQVESPQQALDQLEAISGHLQGHIELGGQQVGMGDAAKGVMAQIRSFRPIIKMLTMQAAAQEKQQEAQQAQQEKELEDLKAQAEGKEQAVKMHEVDLKGQLKAREQDLLHQARMTGVQGKNQIDLIKTQNKMALDRIAASAKRVTQGMAITGNPPPDLSGMDE